MGETTQFLYSVTLVGSEIKSNGLHKSVTLVGYKSNFEVEIEVSQNKCILYIMKYEQLVLK